MKIRKGFVSNSSSSSFCLYGIALNESTYDYDELYDRLDDSRLDLRTGLDNYYEQYVVGLPPQDIREDETFKQFSERVKGMLRDVRLPDDASWCIDGGHD